MINIHKAESNPLKDYRSAQAFAFTAKAVNMRSGQGESSPSTASVKFYSD